MRILITTDEVKALGVWSKFCEVKSLNRNAVDGGATRFAEHNLTIEQALECGLSFEVCKQPEIETIIFECTPSNEGTQELIYDEKSKVNLIVRNQQRQCKTNLKYKITIEEIL